MSVTENYYVLFDVGAEFLNNIQISFDLKLLNLISYLQEKQSSNATKDTFD